MHYAPYAPLFSRTATNPVVHAGPGAAASAFVDVLSRPAASDMPTGVPVLAHAVLLDDAQASGMVVQAQAVPVLARVARARAVQAQAAQEQAVEAQAAQEQVVVLQAVPGGWLETIASYDLKEPFPLRIGAFAGDSNKEALAV